MKGKFRFTALGAIMLFMLLAGANAHAEWTGWGRATQFYVNDAYPGIIRVYHNLAGQPNPAACPSGGTNWIDIEINPGGRTEFEMEQMVNSIYMSMATSRNLRFDIDTANCSPDGFRLATGVGLQNL